MADLAQAINLLREENRDNADRTIGAARENKEELSDLNSTVGDLVATFKQKALDDEEARRERSGATPQGSGAPDAPADPNKLDLGELLGLSGIIAGITGAIAGTVAGIIKDIRNLYASFKTTKVFKDMSRVMKNLSNAFKAGLNGVRGLSRAANGSFRNLTFIEKAMNGLGKVFRWPLKAIKGLGNTWTKAMKGLIDGAKGIGSAIKNAVMKPINFISNGFKSVMGMFNFKAAEDGMSAIKNFFQRFKDIFTKVFKVFKNIGSKIFFPITVIMGIFDGITGAIDGFTRQGDRGGDMADKIIGGITGALGGIVSGIVGGLLDMAKSLISWIAGALGFEQAEQYLDSFSFAEGITEIFNGIADWFVNIKDRMILYFNEFSDGVIEPIKKIFSGEGSLMENLMSLLGGLVDNILLAPVNMIKGLISSIMDMFGVEHNLDDINIAESFMNKLKEIARSILPDPDSLLGDYIVPDALYEWAGIDPGTGKVIGTASEASADTRREFKGQTTEQLEEARNETFDQRQKAAAEFGSDSLQVKALEAKLEELEKLQARTKIDADKSYSESREAKQQELGLKAKPEVPEVKAKEVVSQDMDRMTRENYVMKDQAAGNVTVAAPVTNVDNSSTSQTAAVMDNNLSARDWNDRYYSNALGFGS